jgi:hypothetical protein
MLGSSASTPANSHSSSVTAEFRPSFPGYFEIPIRGRYQTQLIRKGLPGTGFEARPDSLRDALRDVEIDVESSTLAWTPGDI